MRSRDLVERATKFLLVHGKAEVGFFAQEIGVGPGVSPTTANCILALARAGQLTTSQVESSIQELLSLQHGPDSRYAYSFCIEELSSSWATSKALGCILALSPNLADSTNVAKSIDWLIVNRNPDNGWGYRKSNPSRPYYTFFAIETLVLAARSTSSVARRRTYEETIRQSGEYLLSSQIGQGIWSNGTDTQPCPINTLMGLAALRLADSLMGTNSLTETMLQEGHEIIRTGLRNTENWKNYSWSEPGIAFKTILAFPPGKIHQLLMVFDALDPVCLELIQWLMNNYLEYGDTVGWAHPVGSSRTPQTWVTALSVSSIVEFDSKGQSEMPIKRPAHETEVAPLLVDAGQLRILAVLLGLFCTFTYILAVWTFFGESFRRFFESPFDFTRLIDAVGGFLAILVPVSVTWALLKAFVSKGRISRRDIVEKIKYYLRKI